MLKASQEGTVEVLLRTPAAAAVRFRDCRAREPGVFFSHGRGPGADKATGPKDHCYYWELDVIILGVILLIIGFIAKIAIVWTIGIIVVVVGAILMLLGMMGHAVGGRRHYY
jgi:hypothetical protein